jgi:branched-chain amino acid transport system permease protein
LASSEPRGAPRDAEERYRWRQAVIGAAVLAVLVIVPFAVPDPYARNILILTLMYAGLAQAWNILGGYCGQISLGQALFFGIGGYIATLLDTSLGVPTLIGMIPAGIGAALVSLVVGWPCFRMSGHYYAIATLVVAQIGYLLFLNWEALGGASGIFIPFVAESWLHLQFRTSKLPFYYAFLALAAFVWLASYALENSRWGFAWRAIKDDPIAAESVGVTIFRAKLVAAAASAFFTGIGGAIYAQFVAFIDPDSMLSGPLSILIALPAVLGGVGTLWGPALGAAVLIPLSETTRSYVGGSGSGLDLVVYGALVMVVAVAKPQGLVGLVPALQRHGAAPRRDAETSRAA